VQYFRKEFGALICPVLLGLELDDPEDYERFKEKSMWENKCKQIISKTVKMAYNILKTNI
jgi:hypothetical protein